MRKVEVLSVFTSCAFLLGYFLVPYISKMANVNQPDDIGNQVPNHVAHLLDGIFVNGHEYGQAPGHEEDHGKADGNGNENTNANANANANANNTNAIANITGAVPGNGEGPVNAEADIDADLPAWAMAAPVNGYIKHPTAGFIMHPSFYDNRHLIDVETKPRYNYDGEVDGPLCAPSQKCTHVKNCFEVRVRMAVLAYRVHHISFRDAEYIWRVSRSTIQRRKTALDKCSGVLFLVTPKHPDM